MAGVVRLLYRFGDRIRSIGRDGDRITLHAEKLKPLTFVPPAPPYADAVMALHGKGATLAELANIAGSEKAAGYVVDRFTRARFLEWSVTDDREVLAGVASLAGDYLPRAALPPPGERLALCRLACLRRHDGQLILDSGAVRARATLSRAGIEALAASLAEPRPAVDDGFAAALWQLGFFDLAEPQESDARRTWQFADLMLHESSRFDRNQPLGTTYRFKGRMASPPAIKPAPPGERIELPPVDVAELGAASRSLDAVQARRRSIKRYAKHAISLGQVSEFLWRVGRTTGHGGDGDDAVISRPYPSGGSLSELELYLAVQRCEGLAPAVYHYDSHGHALTRLADSTAAAGRIIERSAQAMALPSEAQRPDLTIVISSRLPRVAWKYDAVAYRLSLLNVGVVFELMYLVATDMGLAPCANGSGNSQPLQAVLGGDPFEEIAIGEFCLALPASD
jgi:SagB-type dehydrogenase family enzyme